MPVWRIKLRLGFDRTTPNNTPIMVGHSVQALSEVEDFQNIKHSPPVALRDESPETVGVIAADGAGAVPDQPYTRVQSTRFPQVAPVTCGV